MFLKVKRVCLFDGMVQHRNHGVLDYIVYIAYIALKNERQSAVQSRRTGCGPLTEQRSDLTHMC